MSDSQLGATRNSFFEGGGRGGGFASGYYPVRHDPLAVVSGGTHLLGGGGTIFAVTPA